MDEIRIRRNRLGLSQVELGEKFGMSGAAISRYESGDRSPDVRFLAKLANFFGCTVDELVNPITPRPDGNILPRTEGQHYGDI